MPHLFDCSCRLRVQVSDPDELHRSITSFQRLADQRDEIVGALFANGKDEERVDLVISAEDVAAARALAKGILGEIEQYLNVRFGTQSVRPGEVVIREALGETTRRLGTVPADGYGPRVLANLRQFRRHPIPNAEAELQKKWDGNAKDQPSAAEVLAKLDEWRVFSRFEIVDLGPSNLTLHFQGLPRALHHFAEEVFLFCPQIIDEVDALDEFEDAPAAVVARVAVEGIAENLNTSMTLRLWWN